MSYSYHIRNRLEWLEDQPQTLSSRPNSPQYPPLPQGKRVISQNVVDSSSKNSKHILGLPKAEAVSSAPLESQQVQKLKEKKLEVMFGGERFQVTPLGRLVNALDIEDMVLAKKLRSENENYWEKLKELAERFQQLKSDYHDYQDDLRLRIGAGIREVDSTPRKNEGGRSRGPGRNAQVMDKEEPEHFWLKTQNMEFENGFMLMSTSEHRNKKKDNVRLWLRKLEKDQEDPN